jgi:periplasmic protein TonB
MPSSELEDKVWPDLTASTRFSRSSATHWSLGRGASLFWWGVSWVVHLLLLVMVGLLTRHMSDISQAPPIRVTVVPTMALSAEADAAPQPYLPERRQLDGSQSQMSTVDPDPVLTVTPPPLWPAPAAPERAVAPLTSETPTRELLEVMPEVMIVQELPPLLEPPQAVAPDWRSPDVVSPVMPVPPPVVAQAPAPPRAPPPPARKWPTRSPPPTTFDDPMLARLPPPDQNRGEVPPIAAPGARRQAPPLPQASLPPATGARYGQNPRPSYPYEARRRGLEGTVLLLVEILESGRPERITIKQSSGHSVLDEAARGAVGRWSFIPAQREGKPVRSVAEVPIVFSLRKE